MWVDAVNACFELFGGVFLWFNVWQIRRDRKLRGVHWVPTLYFSAWGFWNLFYYPSLGQWFSFVGSVSVVVANIVWLSHVGYYLYADRNDAAGVERTGRGRRS